MRCTLSVDDSLLLFLEQYRARSCGSQTTIGGHRSHPTMWKDQSALGSTYFSWCLLPRLASVNKLLAPADLLVSKEPRKRGPFWHVQCSLLVLEYKKPELASIQRIFFQKFDVSRMKIYHIRLAMFSIVSLSWVVGSILEISLLEATFGLLAS